MMIMYDNTTHNDLHKIKARISDTKERKKGHNLVFKCLMEMKLKENTPRVLKGVECGAVWWGARGGFMAPISDTISA